VIFREAPVRLHRIAWIALLGACGLAGGVPARAAFEPALPDLKADGKPQASITIGAGESARDYYRIDREACPLTLEGPGTLRIFIRADIPPGFDAPDSAWVTLEGLLGFPTQRWALGLTSPKGSSYPGGRKGRPTSAERIALIVPAGRNELRVSGTSDIGENLYAAFTYERVALPPPVPEVIAPPAETPATTRPRKTPRPPAPPPPTWWFGINVGLGTIYDDNIMRLSDASIEEFRRNQSTMAAKLITYDDLILDAKLDFEVGRLLLFHKETALRFYYERWQYMRNDIKTNEDFEVRLRQVVRRADNLELSYLYAPASYIKELSDRPPFVPTTEPRYYLPFEVTRNALTGTYRWRALPWLTVRAIGGRVWRYYNRPFLENDLWEWNARVGLDAVWGRLTTTVHYGYAHVDARGYDSVGETLEIADNGSDGSYEKDWYRLQFAYRPRRSPYVPASPHGVGGLLQRGASQLDRGLVLAWTAFLTVAFDYQRQFYTSELPLAIDALHVGRLDQTKQIQITWASRPLVRRATLEAGWRYTVRTAEGAGSLIGEDPSEEKDYTGSRYWLGIAVPLR
jgi:hypothetical protein